MVEICRYGMITLVAAAMSVVGWQLMAHFPAVWEFDRMSFGLILPSVLLWAFLIVVVRRTTVVGGVVVGLLSPLLGGLLLGGPSGVGVVLSAWPAAFLTGGATGLLVHRCLFWDNPGGHTCGGDPAEPLYGPDSQERAS